MFKKIFFFIISVWILNVVSCVNIPSSPLNQQDRNESRREKRQADLGQYEDQKNIIKDEKLKENILEKLSEETVQEFDDSTFSEENDYSSFDESDENASIDYELEDNYSQQKQNFLTEYNLNNNLVQDPPKENIKDDYTTENYYLPSKDSLYEKISKARRFYYFLKIPLIIIPLPCTTKCELNKNNKSLPQLQLKIQSQMTSRPFSIQQSHFPTETTIITTTGPPQQEIRKAKRITIAPSTNSVDLRIIVWSLIDLYKIRNNILYILGCLLQRPKNFLTEPQYTTLYTLFLELRNKPSIIQFIMPSLKYIPKSDLNLQLKSIMKIFSKVLPSYISYHARFWLKELQQKKINLNSLSRDICPEIVNIFKGVEEDDMRYEEIMKPFDTVTVMIERALGPIFVKIFNDIQKFKLVFSQELFGIILANFPLIPYNPVLDENIRFILEITRKAEIKMWDQIKLKSVAETPYIFIISIIEQILILPNVSRPIKEALSSINIYLKPVEVTYMNPDYQIMNRVNKLNPDIKLLLTFIVPEVFNKETICLKNRLLRYIEQGQIPENWMITEIDGLRYTNPLDLFLAFLTKLQNKIPNQSNEIARTVTALLSVLLVDKQNKQFSPTVQKIDIFTILGYFSNPEFESNVIEIYDKTILNLVSKPNQQIILSKLLSPNTEKCFDFEICLTEVFTKLDQMKTIPNQVKQLILELKRNIPVQPKNPQCKDSSIVSKQNESVTTRPFTIESQQHSKPPTQDTDSGKNIVDITPEHKHSGSNNLIVNNANLVNVLILPPMLQAKQDMTIYINNKGAPVVDNSKNSSYLGSPKVTMPSLIVILKPPEINNPFGSMNPDFKTQILKPLIKIAGSSDLTLILKNSITNLIKSRQYPTTAALILTLLERAKAYPLVQLNRLLLHSIKTFLSGLDLFAVITLPVVLKVAEIEPKNGYLYSIISISEPHRSTISVTPPTNIPHGMLVFVIVNPNKLKEPVDSQDPYGSLLPNIENNTIGGMFTQQLKNIFNKKKIAQFLPNFNPKGYTNKGLLLMVLLQKLPNVPEIALKPHLKKIIVGYIWAILIPAFFTKVSYVDVLKLIDEQPQVKPDTSFLLELLPPPKNNQEREMLIVMQTLLEREDLFDILIILKPTANTSRMELLKMIITGVLKTKEKFDYITVEACKHYNSKIFDRKKGSLPLEWEIKEVQVDQLKIHMGNLIEDVIPFDELSNKDKEAYNNLMEYFKENSEILDKINDFPLQNYETQGSFIIGLFEFLLKNSNISQAAKNDIETLLPQVILDGPGAKPIKNKGADGRRSASELKITF